MKDLENRLRYIDALPLECDGASRLVHLDLLEASIDHTCMMGKVVFENQLIPLHYWVQVGDFIIDFRLKMWLEGSVPNGVFYRHRYPEVKYDGVVEEFTLSGCKILRMLYGDYGM